MLVHDLIHLHGRQRAGDEALIVGDARLTYGDLSALVDEVARALGAAGVGPGDRVAVLGRNSLEYFCLYFALAQRGAILVPLSFWHRPAEHRYVVDDSEPSLIFVEPELIDALGDAGDGVRRIELPTATDRADWQAFVDAGAGVDDPATDVDADSPHMILYTSGTTGRPKGAILSHRRTVDDAMAMAAALRLRSDDTFINYFPPFHVGNWDHMKLFLLVGARVVLMRQFDAAEVTATIPAEQVTVILGVPTMLHELLDHPSFESTDVSSIRMIYYGAYDPSGIMRRAADAFGVRPGGTEMAHTYGLTEGGPFVTLCLPEHQLRKWGSIGRAVPGVDVALLDNDGNRVPPGEPGELCFRGPRMTGYWKNPTASAEALAGGWLHTGDVAVADDEGFLRIVDRKKDMIRSGGQNVYSKPVEDLIQEHPAVAEAAVIGLPDPVYEEQVCAIVVVRDGVEASDELARQLQEHVRTHMAGYNTPKVVQFADALPRNAVGKIQKHLLRDEFGSMFAAPAHDAR